MAHMEAIFNNFPWHHGLYERNSPLLLLLLQVKVATRTHSSSPITYHQEHGRG